MRMFHPHIGAFIGQRGNLDRAIGTVLLHHTFPAIFSLEYYHQARE